MNGKERYERNNNVLFFLGNKGPMIQKEELLAEIQQKLADLEEEFRKNKDVMVGKRKDAYMRCICDCRQLIERLKSQLCR